MIKRFFILIVILTSICPPATYAASTPKRIHWNAGRGYAPFIHATPSGIEIHNTTPTFLTDGIAIGDTLSLFSLTFRAANLSCHPSRRFTYTTPEGNKRHRQNPEWRFWIATSRSDTLFFTVSSEEIPDPLSSTSAVRINASHGDTFSSSAVLNEGIDCFSGFNTWKITATPSGINVFAGNRRLIGAISIPTDSLQMSGFGFSASPAAHIKISDISLTDESSEPLMNPTLWGDAEALNAHIAASEDPLEGYWSVFDRTLEESLLQLGGDYRFAIVKDDNRYLIVYLSGARNNAGVWKPGMVKGILTPDPFPDIYSVTWFDVEGQPLSKDIKAQTGEGETLLIQFPYQSSVVRLRKIGCRF